jgi:hypothetical protein
VGTRIQKVDSVSHRTAYRGPSLLIGLPLALVGGFLALTGFRILEIDLDANAPLWVLGCVGLAFGLAGLMLIVNGARGILNQTRIKALRETRSSDRPWDRDFPWDPQGIRDRPLGRWVHALFGSLLLATFLAPFNYWAFLSGHGPLMVQVIAGLFDLLLVWAAWRVLYHLGQLLKYGRSELRFARFPFFCGEKLEVVFLPNRFDKLRFTLRHVEERFETSSCGEKRTTRQVFFEHYKEQRTLETREPEVEVAFDLPDQPAWQSEISGRPVRYWELLVEADAPGPDFRTTFLLPVYARQAPATSRPSAAPMA